MTGSTDEAESCNTNLKKTREKKLVIIICLGLEMLLVWDLNLCLKTNECPLKLPIILHMCKGGTFNIKISNYLHQTIHLGGGGGN
jgi:hypothetical protein